jgi:hypothetical protein
MDKRKYYVSVGTGDVHDTPVASSYQFEIEATPAEAARLSALLDKANTDAGNGFLQIRAFENDKHKAFDETFSSIYQTIHDLGDDTTKEHIESMGILQ